MELLNDSIYVSLSLSFIVILDNIFFIYQLPFEDG